MTVPLLARPSEPCSPAEDAVSSALRPASATAIEPSPVRCALTGGNCPTDPSKTVLCPGC